MVCQLSQFPLSINYGSPYATTATAYTDAREENGFNYIVWTTPDKLITQFTKVLSVDKEITLNKSSKEDTNHDVH